jgi:hypothetical protein
MTQATQILFREDGSPDRIQVPYQEYLMLEQYAHEADQAAKQLQQIRNVLAAGDVSAESVAALIASVSDASAPQEQGAQETISADYANDVSSVREDNESAQEDAPEPAEELQSVEDDSVSEEEVVEPAAVSADQDLSEERVGDVGVTSSVAASVAIPPVLSSFLAERDPSNHILYILQNCAQILAERCDKRITLSLHRPYVCLWDFDEWATFAYGEIICGELYLSVNKNLIPDAQDTDVWVPPSGLAKTSLVRVKVSSVNEDLIALLTKAMSPEVQTKTGTHL